jgi:hypothetical protein
MEVFRWVRVLGAGRSTVFPKAAVHFPILLQAGRCDTSCASERIAGRMRNRMRGQSNSRCRLASAIELPTLSKSHAHSAAKTKWVSNAFAICVAPP